MKTFTDIEQAKKLAEILPTESADMCYKCIGEDPYDAILRPYSEWREEYKGLLVGKEVEVIPCWSLAALLEAMPEYIRKYDGRVYRNYHLNLYRSYYHCCGYSFGSTTTDDDDNTLYCIGRDNWVDACYGVIMKLHEEELL